MSLYGLIIGIAIVIGLDYFQKHSHLKYFPYLLVLISLIGARAYHVADNWAFYSQNPILIPQTWNGGLGIFGAIIFGLVFSLLYSFINHISYVILLDSITPILPLCQSIGRLGNWVNHENPIWWPEAILDLILFFIIKKFPQNPTAKYFIGYGLIRFVTEFWRHDTWVVSTIKIGQLIGLIFIIIGFLILHRHQSKM
ncbi:MAG: prolipoprotein diacylglyceryl transferase [Candidatus Shapirobacteria bacterium]|nr:prolipoprotein diacylglyceryl transferase [Candidatus Shapirobacteria bacterium]